MAFLTTQLEGGNVPLARADGGTLDVQAAPESPSGGLTDVTGTFPIVVTTPSPGVRNVALSASVGPLSVKFPQFTTRDNTTQVPWGGFTVPLLPVPSSVTLIVRLQGTRTDNPTESQFYWYIVLYYWNGTSLTFSAFAYVEFINIGGMATPNASIAGPTVTLSLAGPYANPYTWTGYVQAFTNP